AMQRRDNLVASADELRQQLEQAQDELAEAAEELKRFELLDEREQERARGAVAAAEQAELDEIGRRQARG
ncbi:MAG: flagellar FliJ family protein, partial [Hyphomicrobiales bacterium]|nr:flagellar FliJ family protein [Hyphomicrobiales bacterium]